MKTTLLTLTLSAALLAVAAPMNVDAQARAAAGTQVRAGSPSAVVLNSSTRILNSLEARRGEFTRNRGALQSFINTEFGSLFDKNYAARQVLGKYGRAASAADVSAFGDALQGNLMRRYGSALLDFNTKLQVRIKSERAVRDMVAVNAEYSRQGGAPINVVYLFRKNGSQWKAFDVSFEGISMVQTFRDQFAGPLQRKSIKQVTADLKAGRISASAD